MALSTLICGNDIDEIEVISRRLQELGMDSDYVNTGKDAQLKMSEQRFYALLVDFNTQNHHSFDVIRYANMNSPSTRVFLYIKSTQELEKFLLSIEDVLGMGVDDVIEKPAAPEKLFSYLMGDETCMRKKIPQNGEYQHDSTDKGEDEEFSKVAIDDFYTGKVAIFDLYIRLGNKHYIKICRKGESFGIEQIKRYRDEKKVTHFFFKKVERLLYIRRMTDILNDIKGDDAAVHQEKTKIVGRLSTQFIGEAYTDGLSPGILKEATDLCKHTMDIVENDKDYKLLAQQIQEYSDDLYGHSTAVMFLATMICLQNEYSSSQSTDLISIGALFHDVGKTRLDPELSNKIPTSMTTEEYEQYKRHPELGVKLINEMTNVSEAVGQIIGQHHELSNGQGFPNKLSGVKIYPLAKTVILADYVVHYMNSHKLSLKKAINFFQDNHEIAQKFDKEAIKCLLNINKKRVGKAS